MNTDFFVSSAQILLPIESCVNNCIQIPKHDKNILYDCFVPCADVEEMTALYRHTHKEVR